MNLLKLTSVTSNTAKKFDLKITEQGQALYTIYGLPKIHKTPIGGTGV